MKKTVKFIAIILAVVLTLSCFCTAFAGLEDGKIEIGIIKIKLPKINLKIKDINKVIDPLNPMDSPIVGFTNSFNEKFGEAFSNLGGDIGEALAELISFESILEGLGNLFKFIKPKP